MEDALRGFGLFTFTDDGKRVLILVLMEDALRGADYDSSARPTASLNPCSNGRCSARSNNIANVVVVYES